MSVDVTWAATAVFSGRAPAKALAAALRRDGLYPRPDLLVTFLDNHDTPRLAAVEGVTPARLRLAVAFLLTTRGIPQITWGDEHWTRLQGGMAGVEVVGDVIYLSMPLRNVGSGILKDTEVRVTADSPAISFPGGSSVKLAAVQPFAAAFGSVDRRLLAASDVLGASRLRRFVRVVLPLGEDDPALRPDAGRRPRPPAARRRSSSRPPCRSGRGGASRALWGVLTPLPASLGLRLP